MFKDNHGFTVREELPLNEFLNHNLDTNYNPVTECVHVVPDGNKIHVYRKVNEGYPNERIKTTIENVRISARTLDPNTKPRDVKNWCFQSGDGETILTFLSALKAERSPAKVTITYYEKNEWRALEDSEFTNETFRIGYETETERNNEIKIDNVTRGDPTNYNANFR